VITATVSEVRVDGRMVAQWLAVVNGCMLDFANGFIDFGDGVLFFVVDPARRRRMFQMSTSVAQIGQGVEISGMPSRIIRKRER